MDEAGVGTRKIEIDQEKMEYINFAYNEEIIYWRKAALDRVLNEGEEKELVDLALLRVLLIRKEKIEKTVNIDEIIFYLKSMYSTRRAKNFYWWWTKEPSFEAMTNRLKTFSEDDENISLKNKCLFGG